MNSVLNRLAKFILKIELNCDADILLLKSMVSYKSISLSDYLLNYLSEYFCKNSLFLNEDGKSKS